MNKRVHPVLDQALAAQREVPGREPMLRYYISLDYTDPEEDPEYMIHIDHYWGSPTVELNLNMRLEEDDPLMQALPEELLAQIDPNVHVRLNIPVGELLSLCEAIQGTLPHRDKRAVVG